MSIRTRFDKIWIKISIWFNTMQLNMMICKMAASMLQSQLVNNLEQWQMKHIWPCWWIHKIFRMVRNIQIVPYHRSLRSIVYILLWLAFNFSIYIYIYTHIVDALLGLSVFWYGMIVLTSIVTFLLLINYVNSKVKYSCHQNDFIYAINAILHLLMTLGVF